MRINHRLLRACGMTLAALIVPALAWAQSVQFGSAAGMHFGLIEFATPHMGDITLGSNGGVSLTGTGLIYQGNAVPGQISITGNTGVVEVKCEATATLGGANTLSITNIDISPYSGVAPGAGTPCQGIGGADPTAVVLDLGSTPNPRLYFGGKLNIPMNGLSVSGRYESNASGGDPVTISAVFQ